MAKAKVKEPEAEVEEKDPKAGAAKDGEAEGAEGEAGAEGEGAPKKSKKKLIIIGAAVLILLLAGGGAAYYFKVFNKHEEKVEVDMGPDGKPIEKPIFYTLPEFLANLNSGKQASFLKTTVILEVAHQADVPQIEANLPRLLDALNTYLRELRPSDLSGAAGIQRLREELLLRANKTLAPVKINDVLFKEIIIQ